MGPSGTTASVIECRWDRRSRTIVKRKPKRGRTRIIAALYILSAWSSTNMSRIARTRKPMSLPSPTLTKPGVHFAKYTTLSKRALLTMVRLR